MQMTRQIGRLGGKFAKESLADFLCSDSLVSFVTLDEMVLNPRLMLCTFQHQISDMKMLILVPF
jgi:hypothetical protein